MMLDSLLSSTEFVQELQGALVTAEAVVRRVFRRWQEKFHSLSGEMFQQRADDLGGCWRFEINCRVGFEILADHIRRRGVQDGFRAYNGSGPRAEAYGRDAKEKYDAWTAKLAGNAIPTADEIAAAVWRHGIRNGFGDVVQAQQILVATEQRTADVQRALAALAEQIAQLRSAVTEVDDINRVIEKAFADET